MQWSHLKQSQGARRYIRIPPPLVTKIVNCLSNPRKWNKATLNWMYHDLPIIPTWKLILHHPSPTYQQRQDTYLGPHLPVASRSRDPEAKARCDDIILVMWCYTLKPGCLTGGSPASLMVKRSGFTMTPGSCKTSILGRCQEREHLGVQTQMYCPKI